MKGVKPKKDLTPAYAGDPKDGYSSLSLAAGFTYCGQVKDGKMHGMGVMAEEGKSVYDG